MGWILHDLTSLTRAPRAASWTLSCYPFETQGTRHVVYIGAVDGRIHELWWSKRYGWQHRDLTAETGAPLPHSAPCGYAFEAQRTQHVVYSNGASGNFYLHELWSENGAWHHTDLTAETGAPSSVPGMSPSAFVFQTRRTQHVVYVAEDSNHLYELSWEDGAWRHADLTAATRAPPPSGSPTAHAFETEGTEHVIYTCANSRIQELWRDDHGRHHRDLTSLTGAPPISGKPCAFALESEGTQHIVFTGAGGLEIHVLVRDKTGWRHKNVTAAIRAPLALAGASVCGFAFESHATQHVVYIGKDDQIHELSCGSSGWRQNNLTLVTGAPPGGVPCGHAFEAQGTRHVVYVSDGGHVIDLCWTPD